MAKSGGGDALDGLIGAMESCFDARFVTGTDRAVLKDALREAIREEALALVKDIGLADRSAEDE